MIVYRMVRGLARWLLRLFYRRIEVVGLEHVPLQGPLVVVANHHNALVDPMLLLAAVPRRLVPVAKAPLFRYPVLGAVLRLVGALPAHRRQDADDPGRADPARNAALFAQAVRTLRGDRAILIFPEGVSQPEPAVMPLRTGAARMVLSAEAATGWQLDTTVLPVGLVYHDPAVFRTGQAVLYVGPRVPVSDLATRYAAAPDATVRALTERIARALRAQIVEAEDRHTLALLRLADAVWRAESGRGHPHVVEQIDWMRRVLRGRDWLDRHAAGRVRAFRTALEAYARDLERAGLAEAPLTGDYPALGVLRYTATYVASLGFELPLAAWGIALHVVPYRLTALAVRLLRPSADMVATTKLAAAVLLFPLCWAAEAWAAARIGGVELLTLFLGTLGPAGFLALTWQERLARVRRDARAFVHFLAQRDLHRHLLARRRDLALELEALGRLVPESVLATTGQA